MLPGRLGATRSETVDLSQHPEGKTSVTDDSEDTHDDEIHRSNLISTSKKMTQNEIRSAFNAYQSTLLSSYKKLTKEEMRSAFKAKVEKWRKRGAFTPVNAGSVPNGSNIIGSHKVYNLKIHRTSKARIVPWGHRDKDKDFLRGDVPSVSFEIFRLVLSLASEKSGILARWISKWHFRKLLGSPVSRS